MLMHLLVLGACCLTVAEAPDNAPLEDDIPVVGRPAGLPFSGACGAFDLEAKAEPTTLRAEMPLALSLTVRATGPVRRPPRRIDLRDLPAFVERFFIEDPPAGTHQLNSTTWVFAYQLKPRSAAVDEVPGVPFVFFNPSLRPTSKGFQIRFTDPIPLRIQPATAFRPAAPLPDAVYQYSTGPELLAREREWALPSEAAQIGLLAGPPLLCLCGYAAWRRLFPDAARRARLRRSRAARKALRRMKAVGAIVAAADYLRERFDLPAAEPTPTDVAAALERAGCSQALIVEATGFFKDCDAARFMPGGAVTADLPARAAHLILAVEEQRPWDAARS